MALATLRGVVWCLGYWYSYWYSHSISWQSPRGARDGINCLSAVSGGYPDHPRTCPICPATWVLALPRPDLYLETLVLSRSLQTLRTVIAGPTACIQRPDKTLRTLTSRFKCHLHQLILIFCSEHQAYQGCCGLRVITVYPGRSS